MADAPKPTTERFIIQGTTGKIHTRRASGVAGEVFELDEDEAKGFRSAGLSLTPAGEKPKARAAGAPLGPAPMTPLEDRDRPETSTTPPSKESKVTNQGAELAPEQRKAQEGKTVDEHGRAMARGKTLTQKATKDTATEKQAAPGTPPGKTPEEGGPEPEDLEALTVPELKERARAAGVAGAANLTKAELVDAIEDAEKD